MKKVGVLLAIVFISACDVRQDENYLQSCSSDRFSAIAVGAAHTCAITECGVTQCWGSNTIGQLGNGSINKETAFTEAIQNPDTGQIGEHIVTSGGGEPTPAPVKNSENAIAIEAGYNHSCALTASGIVKCWGKNTYGQLGDGNTTNSEIPVEVASLVDVIAISTGYYHTCAVTKSQKAFCWGDNRSKQLGQDNMINSTIPIEVPVASIQKISAGLHHTCALTNGSLVCWGIDTKGEAQGHGLQKVSAIATGMAHTCALVEGSVYCFGGNAFGELGVGSFVDQPTPQEISGKFSRISAKAESMCGIYENLLSCWGQNAQGQLGVGDVENRNAPTRVNVNEGVLDVSVGPYHSCLITISGRIACSGLNMYGELGDGTYQNAKKFTYIP